VWRRARTVGGRLLHGKVSVRRDLDTLLEFARPQESCRRGYTPRMLRSVSAALGRGQQEVPRHRARSEDVDRASDTGDLPLILCPIGWLRTGVLPDPGTGSSLRLASRLEGRMIRVAKDNIQAIKQPSRR